MAVKHHFMPALQELPLYTFLCYNILMTQTGFLTLKQFYLLQLLCAVSAIFLLLQISSTWNKAGVPLAMTSVYGTMPLPQENKRITTRVQTRIEAGSHQGPVRLRVKKATFTRPKRVHESIGL
jgi:hypothetical protein